VVAGLIPKLDETDAPTKPFYGPTKPPGNKPVFSSPHKIKKWDAIMLPLFLNAIHRHFLQAALSGISSQGARL